jgi:cytoskeletal protein CcmA (bactofilin family)
MAIWKEQNSLRRDPSASDSAVDRDAESRADLSQRFDLPRRNMDQDMKESVIANGLTIEGRIEGTGDLRIAGNFQGDVNVRGNLTIEAGAKLTGSVRANAVVIAGELQGNVDEAKRVELLETGVLDGNLKADSITVSAGSRMRGQMDFGWEKQGGSSSASTPQLKVESGLDT